MSHDLLASIARRTERMISEPELKARLDDAAKNGRQLRIKLGMDPTAPDVHLGHCVPLLIVRAFQDAGHKAVIIIGDYTARVGDPTGRNTTRPELTGEEIDANAATYVAQIGKVLRTDPGALEIRYNGQWLAALSLIDIIKLTARKSIAQILAREDFANRYAAGVDIRMHEMLYPLLQGYDSVAIDADLELGGSDQLFNNLVGREFQKDDGKPGQIVLVTPLLVGTDGAMKMSKSKKNYIALTDPAGGDGGMFGKIMRVPDALLESYYQLLTDIPAEAYKAAIAKSPRDAKVALAKYIIAWLHNSDLAGEAETQFMTATHGGVPDDIHEFHLVGGRYKLPPILVQAGFVKSNGEASRKMAEGAIRLDGEKVTDARAEIELTRTCVLQMGSRKFVRLIVD